MRICLLYDRKHGGLPKVLLMVASALSRKGDRVLVCGPMIHHEEWKREAMDRGVEVFEMNSHRIFGHSGSTKRAVIDFGPDIVVSAHRGCDVRTFHLCRNLRLPHAIVFQGNPISTIDVQYSGIPGLAVRNYLWKRAISHCSLAICCSKWVASGLKTGFGVPERKIQVIYNGIPLEEFEVSEPKRLSEVVERKRILAVGRLSREKNPHLLVDLIAELQAQGIELEGTWLGDGPLRDEVNRYANRCCVGDLVRYQGNVVSPQSFYHESDFFAHFRVDEAFGLVLAEAQAAGLPIIAFRAGAVPEVAEHGKVGLLSEEGDVSGMATHIKSLLADPGLYLRMSEQGIRSARATFSAEEMGKQYRAAFGHVLSA